MTRIIAAGLAPAPRNRLNYHRYNGLILRSSPSLLKIFKDPLLMINGVLSDENQLSALYSKIKSLCYLKEGSTFEVFKNLKGLKLRETHIRLDSQHRLRSEPARLQS